MTRSRPGSFSWRFVGNIAGRLAEPDSGLNLTEGQIGLAAGIYIAGACTGSLFFSYLTDKYGRKRLFLITLGVYLVFSFLTGFSWNFWSFAFFRFIAGPVIFGNVIGTGSVFNLFIAYLFSAGLMIFAALVEVFLGVRAEGQSLESVARPSRLSKKAPARAPQPGHDRATPAHRTRRLRIAVHPMLAYVDRIR